MPFVNFNVDSYLPCGSRLIKERGKHARFRPVFILGIYFHRLILRFGANLQGVTVTNEMQLSDRKLYLSDGPK